MKGKNIITINGRLYDALTGMPLPQTQSSTKAPMTAQTQKQPSGAAPVKRVFSDIAPQQTMRQARPQTTPTVVRQKPQTTAHTVHRPPQRSQTLQRAPLKKPVAVNTTPTPKPQVQRSEAISKFGSLYNSPVPALQPVESQPDTPPQAPVQHPAVTKALHSIQQAKAPAKPAPVQSSKELKEMLIKERLAQVDATQKAKEPKRRGFFSKQRRLTTVLVSSLAILLLGGYLTYLNLPNISMRVAATRAGVTAANFPSYKPDGYSFKGPITYSPGEVTINFASNTNNLAYEVTQKTSNWDSQAVLDNMVTQQTDSYLTYQERGLTIYSFGNKAAWVNGGVLYTIEGDAQLSGEQILRIATSM